MADECLSLFGWEQGKGGLDEREFGGKKTVAKGKGGLREFEDLVGELQGMKNPYHLRNQRPSSSLCIDLELMYGTWNSSLVFSYDGSCL